MKTVPLADVLWRAANEQLWDGLSAFDESANRISYGFTSPPREFSCDAVFSAIGAREGTTHSFLRGLGCNTGSTSEMRDWYNSDECQGVRYMWLLLAMHVAEDENIMVEIA